VGYAAGYNNQGSGAVALGNNSGYSSQSQDSIAIGSRAQSTNPVAGSLRAIAIGYEAQIFGYASGIAIGDRAGRETQGVHSIAIGSLAGGATQSDYAISIGRQAGYQGQRTAAVAIGAWSGFSNQGTHAIAIGANAGQTNQPANSISIDASNSSLLPPSASSTCIKPLRNPTGDISTNLMFYDASTSEVSYMSGGQAGTFSLTGTFANIGSALDNLSVYMFFGIDTATSGTGTFGSAICYPNNAIVQNLGTGGVGNVSFQFVATRQLQIKSNNGNSYTFRWRLIKVLQL
jgi:hypothetical protein